MFTSLSDEIRETEAGREADAILRRCTHCGFCTATCPTYQLLGDELDGPRGRIYLMKQVLEGGEPGWRTQLHLDRCLTCRACETTCPADVQYGRLLDIGREIVESRVPRSRAGRATRRALRAVLPWPRRFTALLRLGQAVRPVLPAALAAKVPRRRRARTWPEPRHARRMLVLGGCVQPGIAPDINAAAARVLDAAGISLVPAGGEGCCGSVSHHFAATEEAKAFMRRRIDGWWPEIEAGAEAIVMTASGCGALVREYGHLLRHDERYAGRAARVSAMTRDLSEVLADEGLPAALTGIGRGRRIAFHSPCTLQHGQRVRGVAENVLRAAGYALTPVPDAHLCCGSAGTYSLLQRDLSQRLLENKLEALQSGRPELIATANIGCLAHLETGAGVPVEHWIRLLDPAP